MAGAIVNKFLEVFGLPENDDEEEYMDEDYIDEEEIDEPSIRSFWGNKKVVNMPQTQQVRMVISQPTTFEQAE